MSNALRAVEVMARRTNFQGEKSGRDKGACPRKGKTGKELFGLQKGTSKGPGTLWSGKVGKASGVECHTKKVDNMKWGEGNHLAMKTLRVKSVSGEWRRKAPTQK